MQIDFKWLQARLLYVQLIHADNSSVYSSIANAVWKFDHDISKPISSPRSAQNVELKSP